MKLEERDKRVLAAMGHRACSVGELGSILDVSTEELEARLIELVDNGLIYDLGNNRYERTESGRRVLIASNTLDERIDTSPAIEQKLDNLALRPDEADAVRHVYSLIRYWGRVSEAEIVDSIYSEASAGRESPDEWWNELIRERLAALPDIEPPTDGDQEWRYTGIPEIGGHSIDGRRVLSRLHPVYGDVKHALESLELTDTEREAARAAFVYLFHQGEASERELAEAVNPRHGSGYEALDPLLEEVITPVFQELPGIERIDGSRWRYRLPGGDDRDYDTVEYE